MTGVVGEEQVVPLHPGSHSHHGLSRPPTHRPRRPQGSPLPHARTCTPQPAWLPLLCAGSPKSTSCGGVAKVVAQTDLWTSGTRGGGENSRERDGHEGRIIRHFAPPKTRIWQGFRRSRGHLQGWFYGSGGGVTLPLCHGPKETLPGTQLTSSLTLKGVDVGSESVL